MELDTDSSARNYGLRIYNGDGFVDSFPNNHEFITFGFGSDDTRDDRIVSNISAEFNKTYELEAKRVSGVWTFYIDHTLIGTTPDNFSCNNFTYISFFNVGTGRADNIKINLSDKSPAKVPEFSSLGIILLGAGTLIFLTLRK